MTGMQSDSLIYVAGHTGMVGSAIVRRLRAEGYANLLLRTRAELDLTRQNDVEAFFAAEKPEFVFLAAAKVGGIHANSTYPAEFIHDNLAIQTNVIHAAWKHGARRLLFLGSSCIYPRDCPQPIKEEYLLTGPLEPTNEAYAIAKIAGIKMCEAYRRQYGFDTICAMPTNLYGPGDNYHPENSHVIAALAQRLMEAKLNGRGAVRVWGSGTPMREFMHVDDLASASLILMNCASPMPIVNIGTGEEIGIRELALLIAGVVGYEGNIEFDLSKPDGTPRKLLDSSAMRRLGWTPTLALVEGLRRSLRGWDRRTEA
jgi:GDP-L-fucose synthase